MHVQRIAGERAMLRPWREDDAEWYVAARDETVFRFTTERRTLGAHEVRRAIRDAAASPNTAAFAIEDAAGELVGNLAADIDGDVAEVSYFLSGAGRGRGIATDAVGLLVDWLAERGIRRATASVAADNDRSANVLARVGFIAGDGFVHDRLGNCVRYELDLAAQGSGDRRARDASGSRDVNDPR